MVAVSKKPQRRNQEPSYAVDLHYVAAVFGVHERTVQRMAKDGMPVIGRGKYDIRACVQWQITQVSEKERTSGDLNPRDLLAIAQRQRVELEIAQLRNTLIPQDLVGRVFNGVAAMIAGQLEGIGPRMAGELADVDDPALIQARLTEEARAIRSAIAESLKDYGSLIEAELDAEHLAAQEPVDD